MSEKQELRAQLEKEYSDVYTTDEATEAFEFHSFCAPFVRVTNKATKQKGTMEFTHMPRFYFNFSPDRR